MSQIFVNKVFGSIDYTSGCRTYGGLCLSTSSILQYNIGFYLGIFIMNSAKNKE